MQVKILYSGSFKEKFEKSSIEPPTCSPPKVLAILAPWDFCKILKSLYQYLHKNCWDFHF